MSDETWFSERLARWEEAREQGKPVTPEELCADRPERAAELGRRIKALLSLNSSFGTDPSEDKLTAPQAADAAAGAPYPVVPGYEILDVLGQGAMGVVYRARQRPLRRVVALKVIKYGALATPKQRARFRVEAEAIARLQHPNIVQIFEVGEHGGIPYFSLELADGGSLNRKLGGTPLPVAEAACLVQVLAGAIHYAHERGVLHRDLKPANILLAAGGAFKITDFGLAKRLDEESGVTAREHQTETGDILGTASYMAPEQADGKKDLTPAVDVYALGAVLYEAVTGQPPFRGVTWLDTLDQVRSREPVPPSRLKANVPRDLETICLKCLQKDPGRRYGSAAELGNDLGRLLGDEPILARPAGTGERLWRWCRRNPALTAAQALAALVVAMLAAGAFFFLTSWLWQEVPPWRKVLTGQDAIQHEALSIREMEHYQAGEWKEAGACLEESLAIHTRVQGPDHWQPMGMRLRLQHLRRLDDLPAPAQVEYLAAWKRAQNIPPLVGQGRFDEALRLQESWLETARRLLGEKDVETAGALVYTGYVHAQRGQHADAETCSRQAQQICEQLLGEEHPTTCDAYNNLAAALDAL